MRRFGPNDYLINRKIQGLQRYREMCYILKILLEQRGSLHNEIARRINGVLTTINFTSYPKTN